MNDPDGRRATIEDVAAAAGVSAATVSRALRGLPNVAVSTRMRVEQYAEKLDYRADPNASRLAAGRTGAIALAVPVINTWYFGELVAGAEAVFTDAGYDVLVSSIPGPDRRALFVSQTAYQRRADGIIMVDLAMDQAERDVLLRAGVPTVTTGALSRDFPGVVIDNVRVGRIGASHLTDLGHERIGLITGQPEDPLHFSVPDDRRRGFEQELDDRGVLVDTTFEAAGNFSVDGGREAMVALLKQGQPPTAVFAMSDEMAFGAIQAIRESGLEVPRDVSVMGVDDHDLSAPLGLTTIRQNVDRQGPIAARLLLEMLDGHQPIEPIVEIPIELISRSTTAPLSSD